MVPKIPLATPLGIDNYNSPGIENRRETLLATNILKTLKLRLYLMCAAPCERMELLCRDRKHVPTFSSRLKKKDQKVGIKAKGADGSRHRLLSKSLDCGSLARTGLVNPFRRLRKRCDQAMSVKV
jgi:hypothetical protein